MSDNINYKFEVEEEYQDDLSFKNVAMSRSFFGTITQSPSYPFSKNKSDIEDFKIKIKGILTKVFKLEYGIIQHEYHTGSGSNSGNIHFHFYIETRSTFCSESKNKKLNIEFKKIINKWDPDIGSRIITPRNNSNVIGYILKEALRKVPTHGLFIEGNSKMTYEDCLCLARAWKDKKNTERQKKQEELQELNNSISNERNVRDLFYKYLKEEEIYIERVTKMPMKNGVLLTVEKLYTDFDSKYNVFNKYIFKAEDVIERLLEKFPMYIDSKDYLCSVSRNLIRFKNDVVFDLLEYRELTKEEKEDLKEKKIFPIKCLDNLEIPDGDICIEFLEMMYIQGVDLELLNNFLTTYLTPHSSDFGIKDDEDLYTDDNPIRKKALAGNRDPNTVQELEDYFASKEYPEPKKKGYGIYGKPSTGKTLLIKLLVFMYGNFSKSISTSGTSKFNIANGNNIHLLFMDELNIFDYFNSPVGGAFIKLISNDDMNAVEEKGTQKNKYLYEGTRVVAAWNEDKIGTRIMEEEYFIDENKALTCRFDIVKFINVLTEHGTKNPEIEKIIKSAYPEIIMLIMGLKKYKGYNKAMKYFELLKDKYGMHSKEGKLKIPELNGKKISGNLIEYQETEIQECEL